MSIARIGNASAGSIAAEDAPRPRQFRRIVRAVLRHWGQASLTASAELLATELLTNALQHGRGPAVGVRMFLTASHLVIEVADGSPELPVPRNASSDDEDGRGLLLVDAIAEAWGVSPDGTTTWCSLTLS
ncbi:ATP-binding protein [Streptomyces hypolithicus]